MLDDIECRLRRGEREIYIIGASGSGKSSLVAAGLAPRLLCHGLAKAMGSRGTRRTRTGSCRAQVRERVAEHRRQLGGSPLSVWDVEMYACVLMHSGDAPCGIVAVSGAAIVLGDATVGVCILDWYLSDMSSPMKNTILFLAANPLETDRLTLDQEARAIQTELERSGHRDQFDLVTRWAAQPTDLLREVRKLKPTVVHFSGHGGRGLRGAPGKPQPDKVPRRDIVGEPGSLDGEDRHGLYFQGPEGRPQLVSTAALENAFAVAGSSVKLILFNACYSDEYASALVRHIDCAIGVSGSISDDAGRSFAVMFYGGLGDGESVYAAYEQGCAAINLDGLRDSDRPQLKFRHGVDPNQLILAANPPAGATTARTAAESRATTSTQILRVNLDAEIEKHKAFDHDFLRTACWGLSEIKMIAPDYLAFIKAFPRALARLVARVDDEPSRIFLTSILHEELGGGRPDKVHHRLFLELLTLELKLSREDIDSPHLLVSTMQLLSEVDRLYSHSDVVVAVGAQYALEKQATLMVTGVERGFAKVLGGRETEYFAVHRTQEPEHHQRMIECLNHHVKKESEFERACTGARQLMAALNRFWTGVRDNIRGENRLVHDTSDNKLLAFENALLQLLVNTLSPQRNARLDRLRALGELDIGNPHAVGSALEMILQEAALVLDPHLRIYLAVKLESSPLFKIVKSYSQNDPRWLHGVTVDSNSNIAFVYRSRLPRCHEDTSRISDRENQPTHNEGSVAAFPIIVERGDSAAACVAILGISSPKARDIRTDNACYMFGLRLALNLGVLIGLHSASGGAIPELNEILLEDAI